MNNFNWFNFESILTVFRKWPNHRIETNHSLGSAQSCNLNENIFSVDWNLRMIWIDNWWNWQNSLLTIQHQRINWTVPDQVKIFLKLMIFKRLHHAQTVNFILLIQWNELEFCGSPCHILERSLNCIKIMSSDRCIFSVSTEGSMKLFLCSNERLISFIIELNIPQYSTYNERSDLLDWWVYGDGQFWLGEFEFRCLNLFKINFKGSDKGCFCEKVRSVIHTVKFVVWFILFNGLLNFNTELES